MVSIILKKKSENSCTNSQPPNASVSKVLKMDDAKAFSMESAFRIGV